MYKITALIMLFPELNSQKSLTHKHKFISLIRILIFPISADIFSYFQSL
jgi:hypothetical protein